LKGRLLSQKNIKQKIMPQMDGTGPADQGQITGRGMGPCGGGMRRGWGCCGYGMGYGRRRFISPKNEMAALDDEEKMLEEELAAVREEKKALQDGQK
jgi:hypothetical protein